MAALLQKVTLAHLPPALFADAHGSASATRLKRMSASQALYAHERTADGGLAYRPVQPAVRVRVRLT